LFKLLKAEATMNSTDKTPTGLTKVNVCVSYIESCGWLLKRRTKGFYYFWNENAAVGMRDKTFSLEELRETYKTGW